MPDQPRELGKQIRVESRYRLAQSRRGIHHLLDSGTFPVKGRIKAVAMMLDQRDQAASEIALRDLLERFEVLNDLIQATSEALSILRQEARHTAAGKYRRNQHQAIESTSDQTHHWFSGSPPTDYARSSAVVFLRQKRRPDAVTLVHARGTAVTRDKLRTASRSRRRNKGVVCNATGNVAFRQCQNEFSVRSGIQPKKWPREPRPNEVADHCAGTTVRGRQPRED